MPLSPWHSVQAEWDKPLFRFYEDLMHTQLRMRSMCWCFWVVGFVALPVPSLNLIIIILRAPCGCSYSFPTRAFAALRCRKIVSTVSVASDERPRWTIWFVERWSRRVPDCLEPIWLAKNIALRLDGITTFRWKRGQCAVRKFAYATLSRNVMSKVRCKVCCVSEKQQVHNAYIVLPVCGDAGSVGPVCTHQLGKDDRRLPLPMPFFIMIIIICHLEHGIHPSIEAVYDRLCAFVSSKWLHFWRH